MELASQAMTLLRQNSLNINKTLRYAGIPKSLFYAWARGEMPPNAVSQAKLLAVVTFFSRGDQ